ncbi:hypothetical protein [Sorangium sp. So ce117]|uniref:hypothetical protein n=1 Tax=Sorangium sp. So ce117 TaxID=3133277 RepID=UPI003F637AF3
MRSRTAGLRRRTPRPRSRTAGAAQQDRRGRAVYERSPGNQGCRGGSGGQGGPGGYGGPGRGGDSIGVAYLDEDQLTLEGVTFDIGPPGHGGISRNYDGSTTVAEDGNSVKTLRFPESLD